ncbi:MAG: GtrA family protein [Lactovum sp.]
MQSIKKLIQQEGIKYLFFGVLSTVVYIIIKWISYQLLQSGWLSEILAQSAAIIFAFFTNKIWVFQHHSDNILKEFFHFLIGRIALLFFSIFMNWYFVDNSPEILMTLFNINKNLMVTLLNLALQIFTILTNYIYSKFFVFKKKKKLPLG